MHAFANSLNPYTHTHIIFLITSICLANHTFSLQVIMIIYDIINLSRLDDHVFVQMLLHFKTIESRLIDKQHSDPYVQLILWLIIDAWYTIFFFRSLRAGESN